MRFSFLRLSCLVLSVLSPLLGTDTLTFAADPSSPLVEQTYIYDAQGQLKTIIDSSDIDASKKPSAHCTRLESSVSDAKKMSDSPANSSVRPQWDPHRSGTAGEKQVKQTLEDRGERVLGNEITLKTSAGTTRVDMVIRNAQGGLEVVEVKNGRSATLTPNQRKTFPLIQQQGAEPHGSRAAGAGLPERMGPTPVRVIRVMACP